MHNIDSCRKCGPVLEPHQIGMNVPTSSCEEVITWNCLNCNNIEERFHSNHYFFSKSIDNILKICKLFTWMLIPLYLTEFHLPKWLTNRNSYLGHN